MEGVHVAKGVELLGVLAANHIANGIQRDQAIQNAEAKQRLGVSIPVLPFGNNFNMTQKASGAVGKLATVLVGAALGAGGLFGITQYLGDTVAPPPADAEYVIDFEWQEIKGRREEITNAFDGG